MDTATTSTQRLAECTYCRRTNPSKPTLPFFVRKEAGDEAHMCKVCSYSVRAHQLWDGQRGEGEINFGRWPAHVPVHDFEPRMEGRERDEFYCGCRGWD